MTIINDCEIRLGDCEIIPCDVSVDLSEDDSSNNIGVSRGVEEITLDLHEGIVTILKKCLTEKYERNFERCSKCKYFVMDIDLDSNVSNFSCGLGVSRRDMLMGDICLLVD